MGHVLVIDDDDGVRCGLRRMLEEAGFEVTEAENGSAGLSAYGARRPNVVVCDIFMPVKEGLETIYELSHRDPTAAIIAITGGAHLTSLDPLPTAAALGAHRVLHKPFKMQELLDSINEVLAASAAPVPEPAAAEAPAGDQDPTLAEVPVVAAVPAQ
jgi:DNA-binding NtrC family response regulator